MRNLLQLISILVLTSWISFSAFAQPCLSGWQYRQTIEMNNAGSQLTNYQVSVVVNTQVLVALGKARVDGGDIRFSDNSGNPLSFWYDPNEFNTSSTTFWIKANVNAGSSNIFMFYGNATSASSVSGEGTFELFDTFNSGGISPLKWDKCGNNSNLSVVGGTATFESNFLTTPKDYLITSKQSFTEIIITEMKVNSASAGRSLIGVVDNASDGYANVFENSIMKMMKISAGGDCKLVQQLSFPNSTAVAGVAGITGFSWISASSQFITWPSGIGSNTYADVDKAASFGTAKKVIVGTAINALNTNGSLTIDYIRVRKYAPIIPVLSVTVEHEAPVNPSANNTGGYCGGDAIILSTNSYAGAIYAWTGPLGFTSTDANPTPFASTVGYAGTFSVNITMPGGCNAANISTLVDVSSASASGTISGAVTLCEGFNSGTLNLSGENGDILRWEMSNSAIGPWVTLSNTTNSLNYQNLSDTTYYRSVVQSGTCPQSISSPLQVNIDKATVGGFTIGTDKACEGINSGDINLVYQNGNVLKWESSLDGITWNDITSSNTTESYSNLSATTSYRAQVKSGVCPAQYSSQSTITVNPNPVSDFNATTECLGYNTIFTNNSSVSAGSSIVNYSWNFGNGSGSIAQNPINQYTASGPFSVALTTETDKGCNNTIVKIVTVNANPNVDFNFNNVCLGQPMNFQSVVSVSGSSISSLDWDFDDGTTSSQTNVNQIYTAANDYDVTLVATSAQGCVDSITQNVVVTEPVNVDFIIDSVCLGESSNFNNTSSSGSSSVQYTWNFGDGSTSNLISPSHTYTSNGVYSVILQASISGSSTSCQSSQTRNVEIYEMPTANFTFTDECLSDTVSFVNQTVYSGGLNNLTYSWNLNDGNTSTDQDVNHKYNLPGLYSVSMSAETIYECVSSITQQLEVFEMPIANFTTSNVCYSETSEFTNTSLFNINSMSFLWNFDDGTTSTVTSPNLIYSDNGDYDVELITTSANGCNDTIIKTHSVYAKPLANFIFDDVCDGYQTPFTDASTIDAGNINTFSWDFGDGSSASGTGPNHQYLNVGDYPVNLSVISDQLCTHDTTLIVTVNPNPVATFSVTDACIGSSVAFTNASYVASPGTISNLWQFGDGAASNQYSPTNLYASSGLYNVKIIVTSGVGCIDSLEKVAEVFASPIFNLGLDTIISLGDEIELNGFYSGAIGYVWTPGLGLDNNSLSNPLASPTTETNYILTVTDGNGCVGQDSINIEIIENFNLVVNNLITPDNNGVNDFWEIGNIENYSNANVYVYDRWGVEVLKTTNYQNDWNGVSGTDQLPDGTYYYIISVPGQEKVYKGGITVLRNK
jgi:gliding motility-associated-like protein